jgi:uncharacterized protein HemY
MYRAKPDSVKPISLALIYEALGERDEALKWVAEQFEKRMGLSIIYRFDPRVDALKADPRYEALRSSRASSSAPHS